jgi:hypothetical protein
MIRSYPSDVTGGEMLSKTALGSAVAIGLSAAAARHGLLPAVAAGAGLSAAVTTGAALRSWPRSERRTRALQPYARESPEPWRVVSLDVLRELPGERDHLAAAPRRLALPSGRSDHVRCDTDSEPEGRTQDANAG